jgi:hypothetical protein
LHCEVAEGLELDRACLERSWLRAEWLDTLAEVNEQCLELLTEQSTVRTTQVHPILRQVGELWRSLDSSGRRRAAACPYLLVDAGFGDPTRWRWAAGFHVSERESVTYAKFFTVPRTATVARLVFTYAWYLARTQNSAARLILGMPLHCTTLIRACTLGQIHDLAEQQSGWLRPRWPTRVRVWRELLSAASTGDSVALERARMHGLQLLAADMRALAVSSVGERV